MNELKDSILCDETSVHEKAILVLGLVSGKEISIEYEGDVEEIIKRLLLGKKTKTKQNADGSTKKKTESVKKQIHRLRIPNTKEILNIVPSQICYIIKKKQKDTEQPQTQFLGQEKKSEEKKNVQTATSNVQKEKTNVHPTSEPKIASVKSVTTGPEGTKGRCPYCNKVITKDFKTSPTVKNSNKKCIYCGKNIVWTNTQKKEVHQKKESK